MVEKSATDADEFGVTLEQLRKVQAAMRVLIRGIQDTRSKAWEWRDRRDELRSESPIVQEEMNKQRAKRDELNTEVQRQKKLRDEANEQVRSLLGQLQDLRTQKGNERDYIPVEDLKCQLRELEWQQQTTSLTVEEERSLIDEMDRLSQTIETAPKREFAPINNTTEMDQLWQEIQNTREQAQKHHETMIALVEEAQQTHQGIVQLSQGSGSTQVEIDQAHQMFVKCLQEVDEMRARLEVLLEQENQLKFELDAIRKDRKTSREARERAVMEKLAEQARAKQQAGQRLSLEELRALMEMNGTD